MKILDRYIISSFATTFLSVFIILFFIFVLQGIWLFITELAGKDLGFFGVVKFLMFYSPKIVPLVLPLSILLASIMTFGSFAENYEFAAMKSSGISLNRAMKGLVVFICCLSVVAFFFANYVIPKAEYKFTTLRANILTQNPAMVIAQGQFSDIGQQFNINVRKKYGKDGHLLEDVTIHRKSPNTTDLQVVIRAKTGEIVSSENANFLQLILYDGWYYEDVVPSRYEDRPRVPFAKSEFKKYIINFDLSALNKTTNQQAAVVSTNMMLNINELKYTLDSLQVSRTKELVAHRENTHNRFAYYTRKDTLKTTPGIAVAKIDSLLAADAFFRSQVLEIARSNALNVKYNIESARYDFTNKKKNINEHWHAIYEKFVIAYACLLMFFIGAPLGAIIRKGGLGLPIVFAIVIFITFHFINVFGKKLAQEDGIAPFWGAWMSSAILTPFALLLTYRATNDIGLFESSRLLLKLQNTTKHIISKFKKRSHGTD